MLDPENQRKSKNGEDEWALTKRDIENYQYEEVRKELEHVKEELGKLKLDMASVLEEKIQAEKEIEASSSKTLSYSCSIRTLKNEIEEIKEETVLKELARIEAVKELEAIEARRKEEFSQFSYEMENTKKKMNEIIQETDRAKQLQLQLAVTTDDVSILQSGLEMVKQMEKRVQRNESLRRDGASFRKGKELSSPMMLQCVTEELEAAKKELESIKGEAFQFMASMDIIRNELIHVGKETAKLKQAEEKLELRIQNLNSKLLRANAKLVTVSAAEEKAKTIVSNLSQNLKQLNSETEAAKKEKELIREEIAKLGMVVQNTNSEIDLAEEKLDAAIQELEAVKSSELMAFEKLKYLVGNTMKDRASVSEHGSKITISKFEYKYLTERAVGAEEIADKKVAAAQAWIEALKASEREILMKTAMGHRKLREVKVEEQHEEEEETYKTEKAFTGKLLTQNGNSTPIRRTRHRKSVSLATLNTSRSSSVNMRRKKKVSSDLRQVILWQED